MIGQGDPGVAFQQEAALQKLQSDVPEMRELLRWARWHMSGAQYSVPVAEWHARVVAALGEAFASSGDEQLAPKQVRKKQPEKRGQPNADNTARTKKPDGG